MFTHQLPKDPHLLLSTLNMKLRDSYTSLEDLLDDYNITLDQVAGPLASIGYTYDPTSNQFK